jgi:hypothetical protein
VIFVVFSTVISKTRGSGIIPKHECLAFRGPTSVEVGGMANIHVNYNLPIDGELSIYYGKCNDPVLESREQHHYKVGGTTIRNHILAKQHTE